MTDHPDTAPIRFNHKDAMHDVRLKIDRRIKNLLSASHEHISMEDIATIGALKWCDERIKESMKMVAQ